MVSSSVSEADWNRAATHHMLRGSFIKPLRKGRIEEVLRLRTPIYAQWAKSSVLKKATNRNKHRKCSLFFTHR